MMSVGRRFAGNTFQHSTRLRSMAKVIPHFHEREPGLFDLHPRQSADSEQTLFRGVTVSEVRLESISQVSTKRWIDGKDSCIIEGDSRDVLPRLPKGVFQCCVTSPP